MTTRCSCWNCGYVDDYELPYHAKIREYDNEGAVAEGSYTETDDGVARPFICANCGWGMLIVVFWNKTGDPLDAIHTARG